MNKNQEKAIEHLYEDFQKKCRYMVDNFKECRFRVFVSEDGEVYVYQNKVFVDIDNDGTKHVTNIYKIDEAGNVENMNEVTKWIESTHNFLNKLKLHKKYV